MVTPYIYSKGSQWRKWDLHLHSPKTFLENNYGNLSLDNFVKEICNKEIIAIGLTNYFRFDENEIEEIKDKLNKFNITVFPNIEFRTQPPNKDKEEMHTHIIFSEKLNINKMIAFLKRLKTFDNKFCGDLSVQDIKKTFIPLKDILDLPKIETNLKYLDDYLIVACPRGQGSFRPGKQDDGRGNNLAIFIDQNTDILFGKAEDTEYFLKKDRYEKAIEKPVILCSDAHRKEDISKNFTWIKAEPTFEGLKQILYDPKNRVSIQELEPEQKSDYQIIDKVEYENNNGKKETIFFNQNLNSIIGSRAMGKSNLIKNIAYSVNPNQVVDEFLKLKKFKLFWKDNTTNTITESEPKEKGILFIHQGYLGKLVIERREKENNFDKFLSTLFKNAETFKKAINDYQLIENKNIVEITSLIRELLLIKQNESDTQGELIKLGKKTNLENEIIKIEKELNERNKNKTAVTSEELNKYKRLKEDKFIKNQELNVIGKDLDSFELLKRESIITAEKVMSFEFSNKYINLILNKIKESDTKFKNEFIEGEVNNLKKQLVKTSKDIDDIEKEIKPIKEKLEKHKALLDLAQNLQDKKEVLQKVINLLNNLKKLNKNFKNKIEITLQKYFDFNDEYKNIDFKINNLLFSKFNIIIDFNRDDFLAFLEENINYHNSLQFKTDENKVYKESNVLLLNPFNWFYIEKDLKVVLEQLVNAIINDALLIKSGKNKESVLQELFLNRFKIDFSKSITNKNNEEFNDMSDGEKMIALLELIFKFDNYYYPVLIDQPEDDLDVKAISKHVVDFLTKEKAQRQVIIVSHNANLVVCSDSEEVIVANKSKGKNPNFEYRTGAIENEIIRKEIIEILEGGEEALRKRKNKLNIKS